MIEDDLEHDKELFMQYNQGRIWRVVLLFTIVLATVLGFISGLGS